jgi:hypothetical protein
MYISKYFGSIVMPFALGALMLSGCSSGGTEDQTAGVEEEATAQKGDYVAGKKLYSEKLSQTASLEVWDQGEQGIAVHIRGHKDYDADKQQLLQQAVDADGSTSLARLYQRLNPKRTEIPSAVLEIDRLSAERLAGRAAFPKFPGRSIEARTPGQVETGGEPVPSAEPSALPRAGEANLTWMAVWFRDTFCSYQGHNQSVCLLDTKPAVERESTGRRHIITANTDYEDIRFRTWSSDCQFWCPWEERHDVRVPAGHWDQWHWLNTNITTDRKGRIDAWDKNRPAPLIQFAMTWVKPSGGNFVCKATGGACSASSDCCIVPGGAQCIAGVCKNDPTPNANCDWAGEFCCGGTATSQTYCNRTWDSKLFCNAGVCAR